MCAQCIRRSDGCTLHVHLQPVCVCQSANCEVTERITMRETPSVLQSVLSSVSHTVEKLHAHPAVHPKPLGLAVQDGSRLLPDMRHPLRPPLRARPASVNARGHAGYISRQRVQRAADKWPPAIGGDQARAGILPCTLLLTHPRQLRSSAHPQKLGGIRGSPRCMPAELPHNSSHRCYCDVPQATAPVGLPLTRLQHAPTVHVDALAHTCMGRTLSVSRADRPPRSAVSLVSPACMHDSQSVKQALS